MNDDTPNDDDDDDDDNKYILPKAYLEYSITSVECRILNRASSVVKSFFVTVSKNRYKNIKMWNEPFYCMNECFPEKWWSEHVSKVVRHV